jgi:hypothetical protein
LARSAIETLFADYFKHWGLELPAGAVERKEPGEVRGEGWTIRYVFGSDERGDYLDFLATHRMTNERHRRLRETGEAEGLPSPWDFYAYDGTEPDRRRKEAEYFAHNRQVYDLLREKGLMD